MKKILLSFLVLVLLLNNNAYAYIDPGMGSIIIQSIIAAIVGGCVALNMYRIKIKIFNNKW